MSNMYFVVVAVVIVGVVVFVGGSSPTEYKSLPDFFESLTSEGEATSLEEPAGSGNYVVALNGESYYLNPGNCVSYLAKSVCAVSGTDKSLKVSVAGEAHTVNFGDAIESGNIEAALVCVPSITCKAVNIKGDGDGRDCASKWTLTASGYVEVYADGSLTVRRFGINDAGIDSISMSLFSHEDANAYLYVRVRDVSGPSSYGDVLYEERSKITIPGQSRLVDVTFNKYPFSFNYELRDVDCNNELDQHNLELFVELTDVDGRVLDSWTDSAGVDTRGNLI